ncbi:MAG: O-antigen ligase family protein [Candidatus Omnitrophica bacterium]|nr:O-antigen ligase family protein [Candidatus Omnitrophota bacterium]MBU0881708.1 O-antigen ligase family protein [Candidatus Omnitrophota bacterium]MBU1808054.1 O-antigen ligase family protein [Candidatus Omnitrophota bacterium]
MNKERLNIIFDETIKWCLYAIVFAAPFSKSISEIGITLAIAVWIAQKLLNRDLNPAKIELGVALAIFVIAILPSFINTAYPALSIKAFFSKVLKYVFLCVVMADTIRTKERLKDLLVIAFLSIMLITLDGYVQHYGVQVDFLHNYPSFSMRPIFAEVGFFRGYPTASFPYPNDLAAWILLMLLPLACVTVFDMKKSGFRYLTGFVSVALFYLFFLAKARGAWIGLGISMLYIAFSKRKIWIVLLLVIVLFASIVIKTEMTRDIFATGSFSDRVSMLGTSWQIFARHPIIGNGLNTFFVNFKKHRNDKWKDKKGSYAHNCYLQMAADTGIIGLAGFLFLIGAYFRAVIRALKVINDDFFRTALWGISIGVFAFLVHSFFDTNLYSLNLATLFWFAIGTSLAIIRVSRTTGL